jgi:hypothetical protein
MDINRNNYELFFIDYVDGKLTAEQISELMLFIAANPDLKDELNSFEFAPVLEFIDKEEFSNKHLLKKKEFTKEQINNALVDELEGSKDFEYNEVFNNLPEQFLLKERKLMGATRLKPDYSIEFPNKRSLKRNVRVVSLVYYYSGAVAACLLIAFGVYNWFNNEQHLFKINYSQTIHKRNPGKHLNNESNSIINQPLVSTIVSNAKRGKLSRQLPQLINKVKNESSPKSSASAEELIAFDTDISLSNPEVKEIATNIMENQDESSISDYSKNLIMADKFESLKVETFDTKVLSATDYVYKNLTGQLPKKGRENRLMNLARLAAAGLEKLTGRETKAQKTQKDCATKYNFKIGGIEFERTIACK